LPLWIQVSEDQHQELKVDNPNLPEGDKFMTDKGNIMVELHVDSSEVFEDFRASHPNGGHLSVRSFSNVTKCRCGHDPEVCKCYLPLHHVGQDESIFKAYQRGKKVWKVCGVVGLRKKTDGPGQMVSAFQDEIRGYGFPMDKDELQKVNEFRASKGREPLIDTPGVRYLDCGSDKEGWWNWEKFEVQVIDFLDCFEVLHPNHQLQMKIDWSSGHAKFREGALNARDMNVEFGGKRGAQHDTLL